MADNSNRSIGRSPLSTPSRTPQATRPYLSMGQTFYQHSGSANNAQFPSMSPSPGQQHQDNTSVTSENKGVIYGTTINTNDVLNTLERFIREFEINEEMTGMDGEIEVVSNKKYLADLKGLVDIEEIPELIIKGAHLKEFNIEVYLQLIYFPAQMISCFDMTVKNMFESMFIEHQTDPRIIKQRTEIKNKMMVGIVGLDQQRIIRSLSNKDINRLISFRGIVIRCSDIYPEMKSAHFRCQNEKCGNEVTVVLENARVEEPKDCEHCKTKNTMEIVHNLCFFTDKQFIKFQELPEYVPEGETPHSLTIVAYDYHVDSMKPGDRVEIVGIYRAQPVRVERGKRIVRSVFNTYIDLISSSRMEDERLRNKDQNVKAIFDDHQKNEFFKMAEDPKILDKLVQSFAPSIFGNDDVKRGILAQLFGGSKKQFEDSGRSRFRYDVNILLVGDPSTAKSQLLQQIHKISPRGIYTSGRGSSAVGLTANVRKDPETRQYVLESGALVLSDQGICCIDEFDKMDENSKTILLEAMEQQTISIAKAGIVCSLNARTSILAAANPIQSRYNSKKSVVQNINMPPALLSRFDLIYIMLDTHNEAYDTKLAHHILDIFSSVKRRDESSDSPKYYPRATLANYITFARDYYYPKLTEASSKKLIEYYVHWRNLGNNQKTITATPRQLEALIRLSEAIAKMRLSNEVELRDVEEAIRLMEVATQMAATDPTTGLIDMDAIVTGRTASYRSKISNIPLIHNSLRFLDKICEIIKKQVEANLATYRKGVNFDHVMRDVISNAPSEDGEVNADLVREALRLLQAEDFVALYGPSKRQPSVRLGRDVD